MLLGAMNHPMKDVVEQVGAFREAGFDFLDLTLEPARALAAELDVERVRRALAEAGMGVVGHTAWYLPIASPFEELREVALREIERSLEVFAALGVARANVHPNGRVPLHSQDWIVSRNVESLRRLAQRAGELGLTLMLENLSGHFGRPDVLKRVFEAVPTLAFHLDVGHANLGTAGAATGNTTGALLESFGARLAHVHLSDNKGTDEDLHLPVGAGTVDWPWVLKLLKRHGYDGTITLEVFTPDPEYLAVSGRKVRQLWAAAGAG